MAPTSSGVRLSASSTRHVTTYSADTSSSSGNPAGVPRQPLGASSAACARALTSCKPRRMGEGEAQGTSHVTKAAQTEEGEHDQCYNQSPSTQ